MRRIARDFHDGRLFRVRLEITAFGRGKRAFQEPASAFIYPTRWEPLTRIGNSVFLRCFVIMLAFRSQSEAAAVKNNIELCATLSTITKQLKYENDTSIVLSNIMDYHEMRYADMV